MYKKLLSLAFICLLIFALAGCTKDKQPKPEDTFATYIKAWNQQNFSKMYDLLSADAKKTITKDKFVQRYKDIYSGIEAGQLKVSFDKPKKEKEQDLEKIKKQSLTYHVKMNTLAGPLSFSGKTTLTKVEQKDKPIKWAVGWTPTMILPGLEKGQLVRVKTIPSERGEIVDQNGSGLAINGQVIQIGLFPKELAGHDDTKAKLAKILNVPENFINNQLGASWVTPETFVPIKTVSALDTKVIDAAVALPGVLTQKKSARVYPCGEACAHLVGYVGTITKEQLDKDKGKGYTASSVIGKKGLELLLEDKLRGTDGGEIYTTDQDGNVLDTIAQRDPKNGQDIQLTIDVNVQKALYDQLKSDTGTSVALNPKTGDVLGLVSTPSFDPNQFVLGISNTDYNALLNNPEKPLLNRFSSTFTPGSTLKPLTAAIALNTGAIKPDTVMTISGKTWQKDDWKDFHVTRVDSLPKVNLRDAIVHSDNIYFARTALAIGKEKFIAGLDDFGFGKDVPFDYPIEKSQVSNDGTINSEALLANSGYGQGQINVSPLLLALDYTAFVNNGNVVKPQLIKGEQPEKPSYWLKNVVPADVAKIVHDDMVQVVQSPAGTAYNPRIAGLPPLAGKTGTAEFKEKQGEKGKEDGWFIAFNSDNPSLEIAMMVTNVQDKGGSHYVVGKVKNAFAKLLK